MATQTTRTTGHKYESHHAAKQDPYTDQPQVKKLYALFVAIMSGKYYTNELVYDRITDHHAVMNSTIGSS